MSVSTLIPDYRTAGIFLLLTALATAISVPARLAAGADDTPLTDTIAQSLNLDAAEIARLEVSEKLVAIGSASVAYGTGGAARLLGGLTLLAASVPLWRVMGGYHPVAMALATVLLAASGIASAVSGASVVALAVLAPEPQATAVLTAGWASSSEVKEAVLAAGGSSVGGVEDALFTLRWVLGSLGFTLAGLALATMAPVQWRMGGLLRALAVAGGILGFAMLFIWVDAATAVHRISGIAFLVWLIVVGVGLVAGKVRPPADSISG